MLLVAASDSLDFAMNAKPNKPKSMLTVRLRPQTLLEFHAAAEVKGSNASVLVRELAIKTIHEQRERDPEGFEAAKLAQMNKTPPTPKGTMRLVRRKASSS